MYIINILFSSVRICIDPCTLYMYKNVKYNQATHYKNKNKIFLVSVDPYSITN